MPASPASDRAVQMSQSAARIVTMKSRPFGNSKCEVSVIGQGTWYIDRGDRRSAVAALRRGVDLGMTHIDTAEMYGDAEPVIAEAIAERREDRKSTRLNSSHSQISY